MNKALSLLSFIVIALIACEEPQPSYFSEDQLKSYSGELPVDSLIQLYQWAMSSDDGLWEDLPHKRLLINSPERLTLNDALQDSLFIPGTMDVFNEYILVSDYYHQRIMLADTSGVIHWIIGEKGEGPEHYTFGPFVSINSGGLCIWDTVLQRLDVFEYQGTLRESYNEYVNYAISTVASLIRISTMDEHGLVRILDETTGESAAAGNDDHLWSWENVPAYSYGVFSDEMNSFASVSFSHTHLVIASLDSLSCKIYPGRNLPFDLPSNGEIGEANGATGYVKYFLYSSMFTGPDGMINLQVVCPNTDGSFPVTATRSDNEYTLIDRYNWNGEYVDSYILPISRVAYIDYSDNYLYAIRYEEETIYRLAVLKCP